MSFTGRGQGRFSTKHKSSRVSQKTDASEEMFARRIAVARHRFPLQDVGGALVGSTSCSGLPTFRLTVAAHSK